MRSLNKIVLEIFKRRRVGKGELADILGLSRSTISYFIAKLSKMGIVKVEKWNRGRGRPVELVYIHPDRWRSLGVKVGREEVVGILFDALMGEIKRVEVAVSHDMRSDAGYSEILEDIFQRFEDDGIVAVGVGASGIVDGGRLESPILGVRSLDLISLMRSHFKGAIFEVVNDVEALALYEEFVHGGRRFLVINYGTGIGAAFYDGKLLRSKDRSIFQIGHVVVDPKGDRCYCGKRGCLETVASDYANLKRFLREKFTIEEFVEYEHERFESDLERMRKLARSGELDDVYSESIEKLGLVLSNIVHMLEPEKVVIYGEGAFERFVERLSSFVGNILRREIDFECRCDEKDAVEKGLALSAVSKYISSGFRV